MGGSAAQWKIARLGLSPELEEVVSVLCRAGLPAHSEARCLDAAKEGRNTCSEAKLKKRKDLFHHFSNLDWLPKEKLSFQVCRMAVQTGLNQRSPNSAIWLKPQKFSQQAI